MSAIEDAAQVAALFAVNPSGTGGVWLRSQVHPVRDQWLLLLRDLLPPGTPVKRIPFNIGDERLIGGLDLAATLRANRPIAEQGVLAAADGGVIVVAMAERLAAHTAACLGAVLDCGEITLLREGISARPSARVGVVALDEGIGEDECAAASLLDRMAFSLDFEFLDPRACLMPVHDADDIMAARGRLAEVRADDEILDKLCGTALALGVLSPRASWLAVQVARAAAALDGRAAVSEDDAVLAGKLVLAPRATRVAPVESREPPAAEEAPSEASEPPTDAGDAPTAAAPGAPADPLQDNVLTAAQAAIPHGLLARLRAGIGPTRGRSGGVGRAGAQRQGLGRGRPAGVRGGAPRANARMNVLATLRAAAPWQRVRGRHLDGDARLRVTPTDFRVTISKQRDRTLTVFVVDASGSAALHRLAEAKGAVELLLAECYLRRDQVAVISFRGRSAEILLPPTRSLVRAKRSLAGMPGGGATPLAAALGAATVLAAQAQRRGETPTLVLLTDGRANVARDGSTGRENAHGDALVAAAVVRRSGIAAVFVDTSPRPNPLAGALAAAMNARYVPLPFATSRALSDVVTSHA